MHHTRFIQNIFILSILTIKQKTNPFLEEYYDKNQSLHGGKNLRVVFTEFIKVKEEKIFNKTLLIKLHNAELAW